MNFTKQIDTATRMLIERGKIVEAGFAGYKSMFKIPAEHEARERRAFFAGAQHLFASLMNGGLDEGAESSEGDLRRMDNIARELKDFEQVLEAAIRTKGH